MLFARDDAFIEGVFRLRSGVAVDALWAIAYARLGG
jgi:hypothetical protein